MLLRTANGRIQCWTPTIYLYNRRTSSVVSMLKLRLYYELLTLARYKDLGRISLALATMIREE